MKKNIRKALVAATIAGSVGVVVAWALTGPLDSTFNPDLAPIAYVGMPAVSSHLLYTGNTGAIVNASSTRLYAIDYDSSDWSGNMHSYPLTSRGAVVKLDDWTGGMSAKIDVQKAITNDAVPTGRYFFTRNDATNTGAVFRWTGLSPLQRQQIQPGLSASDYTNAGKTSKILNWVRGNRSDEGTDSSHLRTRSSTVGDIMHSTPVFCPGTAQALVATCGADTVFVGANDGILHAINAATGTERWGYIPSMLIPKLPDLTLQGYNHEYFVDGRMVLRRIGAQTVLVGALGGGGKGVFALDVTNAAATTEADAATKLLWEITNTTTSGCSGGTQCFANLGYTYGQPLMATLQDGTAAAIFNNGYGATSGRAVLFIVNAVTGALIREVVMTDGGSTTTINGLSSATVITDFSGLATYAYAGDLMGNMWKIQLYSPYTVTNVHSTQTGASTGAAIQSITMAPGIMEHPVSGYIVCFVTGRELLPDDDLVDGLYSTVHHYAYGVWDTPGTNTALLTQTLTERSYMSGTTPIRIRTATNNDIDWGTHKGWRTQLPMPGERVIGDGALVTGSVFMFMSYNPTITATPPTPDAENWWMQLNAVNGGDNGSIRFDLDNSGVFDSGDQLSVTVSGTSSLMSPVGRNMGGGRRSQLTALDGGTFNTYQANYDKNIDLVTPTINDPGVAGGHFDYDNYYYRAGTSTTAITAQGGDTQNTGDICAKTTDVNNELNEVSPTYCGGKFGPVDSTHNFLKSFTTGAACGQKKARTYLQNITCSRSQTTTVLGTYANFVHVHQYDDKYDVTGVNMLNPSNPAFLLSNMITSTATPFKILVLNQFLNPAATLTVGPGSTLTTAVSVKTYNNLASSNNPDTMLSALPIYTRAATDTALSGGLTAYPITNFIFNLPLNAFQSKDWWGLGGDGAPRAGLIPTQTGCVHGVDPAGNFSNPGPNTERANGALTFQLIKHDTPWSALEVNHSSGDIRYGWRVKAGLITTYVLGEYTAFWHHHNGGCYGDAGWTAAADQDTSNSSSANVSPPAGTGDPVAPSGAGLGGGGGAGTGVTITSSKTDSKTGAVTTTFSDGTTTVDYTDGSTKITLSDGTILWRLPGIETGGVVSTSGTINLGGVTTPPEVLGRINWREVRR